MFFFASSHPKSVEHLIREIRKFYTRFLSFDSNLLETRGRFNLPRKKEGERLACTLPTRSGFRSRDANCAHRAAFYLLRHRSVLRGRRAAGAVAVPAGRTGGWNKHVPAVRRGLRLQQEPPPFHP